MFLSIMHFTVSFYTYIERSSLKYLLKILNCFAIDYTTTPSFVFKTTESNYYWD